MRLHMTLLLVPGPWLTPSTMTRTPVYPYVVLAFNRIFDEYDHIVSRDRPMCDYHLFCMRGASVDKSTFPIFQPPPLPFAPQ